MQTTSSYDYKFKNFLFLFFHILSGWVGWNVCHESTLFRYNNYTKKPTIDFNYE